MVERAASLAGARERSGAYLAIVEGRRRGALAALARAVLALCSLAYGLAVLVRAALYRLGLARVSRAACPVVSVGNLTAGGTGKTPMVEHMARELIRRGFRPAVVSRGYGRARGERWNDEARVLAERLPEVPHVADPDRVRGAALAVARHDATAVVLDDGFQHRRLARDLDLVLIDATAPFGHGWLLPRGLLREPLGALRRAHLAIITRAELVSEEAVAAIRARLAAIAPDLPVAEAHVVPVGLRALGDPVAAQAAPAAADADPDAGGAGQGALVEAPSARALAGRAVLAVSAIGNPGAFERLLERLGARVAGALRFPDHHAYDAADLADIAAEAARVGAEWVVTTHKDAVKLAPLAPAPRPGGNGARPPLDVRVLDVEVELGRGAADLHAALDARIGLAGERAA